MLFAKRSFSVAASELAAHLLERAQRLAPHDLEQIRSLLIHAGQLEQALVDAGLFNSSGVTSIAAELFVDALAGSGMDTAGRQRLAHELAIVSRNVDHTIVDVRIPEGFAWYALYPDQYVASAIAWMSKHNSSSTDVLVVGIRSIGTTLAAVVAAALRKGGRRALATTVRPFGHPFDRSVSLEAGLVCRGRAIVVDEGPGLSGSSFVAVARALVQAGIASDRIDFFTGHANGPGTQLGENNRHWWTGDRVWCASGAVQEVHVTLRKAAERWLGSPVTAPLLPLGHVATDNHERLARAVAPAIATPKLLATSADDEHVVFRFAGLGMTAPDVVDRSRALARADRAAQHGFALAPFGEHAGWIAERWNGGAPAHPGSATPADIERLASYIALGEGEPLVTREIRCGINATEAALMASMSRRADAQERALVARVAERLRASAPAVSAASIDGRMAPHKWLRSCDGRISKIDSVGHSCDHTWVGKQPIAWDLAATAIDWGCDRNEELQLRRSLTDRVGYRVEDLQLAFYRAGYCAFRVAAALHCAQIEGPASGFGAAAAWYEAKLDQALIELSGQLT